jgi:acetyltransferase-like isoleucine patch superfamily enzyme
MSKNNTTDDVFIHPQAIVETSNIGAATRIWAFAHILPGARIGKNCNICDHTFIESDVIIGDDVTVKCGVYLWDGLRIEDSVFIGPNATFTNDPHPRSKAYPEQFAETILKTGSSIGANAVVLCPVTIGRFAMVGAGSVVTEDVPDYTLVYGNPAKPHGYVCRCAKKISFEKERASCPCGRSYRLHNACVEEIND